MEKFGFKNFKKFKDFPMIDLAPITLLVGPNNSGKSSFIKASLLLIYNLIKNVDSIDRLSLRTPLIENFSFFNDTTTNFGWGDLSSSLNHDSIGENIIFIFTSADYEFELEYGLFDPIKGIMPAPNLWKVKLTSLDRAKKLSIEYNMGLTNVSINYEISKKLLVSWATGKSFEIIEPFTSDAHIYFDTKGIPVIDLPAGIEIEYNYFSQLIEKTNNVSEEVVNHTNDNEIIKRGVKECITDCLTNLKEELKNKLFRELVYIETHTASHRSAWDVTDKNNYVAQTLAEYISKSSLPMVDNEHEFVIKWLKEFKIGERFIIREDYNGEILSVDIIHDRERYMSKSNKSGSFTNLGHMGTGSIQLFTMLLKLAISIKDSRKKGRVLLEIEEPEQNLHPALQSKLADIFKDVYDLSGGKVNFIIETHSEYFIRRTQVMVAEMNRSGEELMKGNPFKVYYFPENGLPYDMCFQKNGKFVESFGSGFFDVADNSAMDLFEFEED